MMNNEQQQQLSTGSVMANKQSSSASASWWSSLSPWSGGGASRQVAERDAMLEEEAAHRKRLQKILLYIASMHGALRSSEGGDGHCFVRDKKDNNDTDEACHYSDFFQYDRTTEDFDNDVADGTIDEQQEGCGVLFSANDFRKLIAVDASCTAATNDDGTADSPLFASPPFSFYAASGGPARSSSGTHHSSSQRRTLTGAVKHGMYGRTTTSNSSTPPANNTGLWLRLMRLGHTTTTMDQRPDYSHPSIGRYLTAWLHDTPKAVTIQDLLTLPRLERAPSVPTTTMSVRDQRLIKNFIRRYKRYLRMRVYQQTLEPIYNRLFEWVQQQNENNQELVFGLGHAKMTTPDGRIVNGPLLEVLVEVELAPDGALLVRPREHTGVALNREVVTAIVSTSAADMSSSQHSVLAQIHRTVGELEAAQFAPGQPSTYAPILKRIAVELSPGGAFQASSSAVAAAAAGNSKKRSSTTVRSSGKLMVSEAWCLYTRSKPSSVWARDATILADRLGATFTIATGDEKSSSNNIPDATWSLTHGPSKLEDVLQQNQRAKNAAVAKENAEQARLHTNKGRWFSTRAASVDDVSERGPSTALTVNKPIFPLPTSASQDRAADLLLNQNYPAVVLEGPPGTGKTHSIANIVCAYLCRGKRVLVTSKNANALNVLRGRLPHSVQELCVDVSMSELQGMRQLQQTVERLATRVSVASTDIETEKCSLLQRSINDLETQLQDVERKISSQSERIRLLLQQPDGMKLMDKATFLIQSAPWLMQALPTWKLEDVESLLHRLKALQLNKNDLLLKVTGFESPPPNGMVSLALAKSGSSLSSFVHVSARAVASMPVLGSVVNAHLQGLNEEMTKIKLNKRDPESKDDWSVVARALEHALSVHAFETNVWLPLVRSKEFPQMQFASQDGVKQMVELFEVALDVKKLHISLDVINELTLIDSKDLDQHRKRLAMQIQHHAEELADAAVVAELSRSFTPDAQSALVRFSQIAGASKFSKSAKSSKMTQRQRRRRQEYLDAFDRCCRFIPAWILTTSQISQYLPAETLFDIVICDEASQSDVTVLPGMMRGKQWLIVGDSKQVSPTESFVSEEEIDHLRASLPQTPQADALLPGRSLFDLCAQAFPRGRVVLSEHFRCAPEIIEFSNSQFYDGRLVPLRLPTKLERLKPSLMDVRVSGGEKNGKINEKEADTIVEMIKKTMNNHSAESSPRSIGVISLIGDEQSRLIRGRLLDAVGPELLARHNVLVGDPPMFQGAERDIVFLSMVCSKRSCPTQNQQFHFQRANVALSRARDRCVLVRSIDLRDIPSMDDMKVPIIEFFMNSSHLDPIDGDSESLRPTKTIKRRCGSMLLKTLLEDRGFQLMDMGVVWKDALCVEHEESDTRAAIMVDCEEGSSQEWISGFAQQKAIERVGWKCLRINAVSLAVDYLAVVNDVIEFLSSVGIKEKVLTPPDEEEDTDQHSNNADDDAANPVDLAQLNNDVIDIEDTVAAVSSEEDDIDSDSKPAAVQPDAPRSYFEFDQDVNMEASNFGEVVDLDFLRHPTDGLSSSDDYPEDETSALDVDDAQDPATAVARRPGMRSSNTSRSSRSTRNRHSKRLRLNPENESNELVGGKGSRDSPMDSDDSNDEVEFISKSNESSVKSGDSVRRLKKRKKLDKYSRDGRWYPGKSKVDNGNGSDDDLYDTDSALSNGNDDNDEDASWQGHDVEETDDANEE